MVITSVFRARRWPRPSVRFLLAPLLSLVLATSTAAEEIGIRAPPGFIVETYAGDDLAHDIFSMTLSAKGEVVVAGLGYIKTLHDDNGDGRADRATTFSKLPASGAHGMAFDGNHLICTGDNGLLRLRDDNGDGLANGKPEFIVPLRSPEHGANGVVQGPDGWFYVICGNDTDVSQRHASRTSSPIKTPQCGALVRFTPQLLDSEIVAHGFRNPYDIDFHPLGHIFTVDADGERDHHLPWYAPTRLFDIGQGVHHGWVLEGWKRSWNRPESYFDSAPRLAELGRGSPTGLTVYRHHQFPERYRGSVLSACWTLGRVYHIPLEQEGSSFTAKPEVFLETTGDVGFAPVDLAVGPAGELYVAIGGRRTRGSVFRVRYEPSAEEKKAPPQPALTEMQQLLDAPQPLSAWSRAIWKPLATKLGREAIVGQVGDRTVPIQQRLRGIEIITEMYDGLSTDEAAFLLTDDPRVAARTVWSLSRCSKNSTATKLIATAASSKNPLVARAAWEALASMSAVHRTGSQVLLPSHWDDAFRHPDRRVRTAAILADTRLDRVVEDQPLLGLLRLGFRQQLGPEHVGSAAQTFLDTTRSDEQLLAIRLMILSLGDLNLDAQVDHVFAGYSIAVETNPLRAARITFGQQFADAFPSTDPELNRELARLLGILHVESEGLLERMASLCTADSAVQDDLHYLIAMAQLPGERSTAAREQIAKAIAQLHGKLRARELYVSRNWPERLSEALEQHYLHDPLLAQAIVDRSEFSHCDQAILATSMPTASRHAAARKLIALIGSSGNDSFSWTSELIALAGTLPTDESLAAMRQAWSEVSLRDDIIPYLARAPQIEDQPRLVSGLASIQPDTVETAAHALVMLGPLEESDAWVTAVRALRQACKTPALKRVRGKLHVLLQTWSGKQLDLLESSDSSLLEIYQPWTDELAARFPAAAKQLEEATSTSLADWKARLSKVDLSQGDPLRGREVFQQKSCLRCHAGNSPLGPDLAGAASRLAIEDLLAAIIEPSRDVSPLYQTTQVITGSGRVFNGLLVYESPDATLVQVSADQTVRIAGDEIVSMKKSSTSLMPAGLLDQATDTQLADLFAYLKTLQPRR